MSNQPYEVRDTGYDTPCWVWSSGVQSAGYATRKAGDGRSQLVHRQMYEEHVGPIPVGLEIDHPCRVRACVNPAHLEAVTRTENARRGAKAKLTIEQAREIRGSSETYSQLARRYGIGTSTVWNIRTGRQWKEAA